MRSKVYVTKEFEFESAHNLVNYDGECANLHGHTYKLQVTVSGAICNEKESEENRATDFMVIDFKELKSLVQRVVVDIYDHSYLNDYFKNPTAELMCSAIFGFLDKALPADVKLESVKLWETASSFAEYKGELV